MFKCSSDILIFICCLSINNYYICKKNFAFAFAVVISLSVIEAIIVIILIFLRRRLCIAVALLKEGSK